MVLVVLYFIKSRRPKNFPPGPLSLPIVGYAPFLGDNVADKLMKMKSKFGPVMSIQMGTEDWVVLNGFDMMNEVIICRSFIYSCFFEVISVLYGQKQLEHWEFKQRRHCNSQ